MAFDGVAVLVEVDGAVALRDAGPVEQRRRVDLQFRESRAVVERRQEIVGDLVDGILPGVACDAERIKQALEGQVAVRDGLGHRLLYLRDQLGQLLLRLDLEAERDDVDEHADERLQLAARPVGEWQSDDEVALPGAAGDEGGDGGQPEDV